MDPKVYIRDDLNNVWLDWNGSNFDFWVDCVACDGQIKIKKPADTTPYQPYKEYIVKVFATDELALGNSIESQFTLQLRYGN